MILQIFQHRKAIAKFSDDINQECYNIPGGDWNSTIAVPGVRPRITLVGVPHAAQSIYIIIRLSVVLSAIPRTNIFKGRNAGVANCDIVNLTFFRKRKCPLVVDLLTTSLASESRKRVAHIKMIPLLYCSFS